MADKAFFHKEIQDLLELSSCDSRKNTELLVKNFVKIYCRNKNEITLENNFIGEQLIHLKVLLELYENLLLENSALEFSFQIEPIFNNIDKLLIGNNDLPGFSEEMLSQIVSLLFRIAVLQDSDDNLSSLLKFYQKNLKFISSNYICEDIFQVKLILRLEISGTIYCELHKILGTEKFSKFSKELSNLKFSYDFDECKIFTNLILHGNDGILKKTLLFVLPNLLKYLKDDMILSRIWQDISILISKQNSEVPLSRILLIMCYLFNLCFFENILTDKMNSVKLIFEDKYFWSMLQFGLSSKESLQKKQAMYLLKSAIEELAKAEINTVSIKEGESEATDFGQSFWWNSNHKSEIVDFYKEIILILEYLNEQQVHIIKPVCSKIEKVIKKGFKVNSQIPIDNSWIYLIYEGMFRHESSQVVIWGLNSFFEFADDLCTNDTTTAKAVDLLLHTLNNINIYYHVGIEMSNSLAKFFAKFREKKTCRTLFSALAFTLTKINWSPEALFFVVHAAAQMPSSPYWQEEELNEIKIFLLKAFKTHNKVIRIAAQCELIKSIILFTDTGKTSLKTIVSLLAGFNKLGSLKKGTRIWKKTATWIRKSLPEEDLKKYVECLSDSLKEETESVRLPLLLMLLSGDPDSSVQELDSPSNCHAAFILRKMLTNFENVDKRPYCDKILLNKILILINAILEEENCDGDRADRSSLVKVIYSYLREILFFMKVEISENSTPQNLDAAHSYLKAFDLLLKSQLCRNYCGTSESVIYEICLEILGDLEERISNKSHHPHSPLRHYHRIRLLKTILKSGHFNLSFANIRTVHAYLMRKVNEPLRKDLNSLEKTMDAQAIWGKINSKFLENKWQILEFLTSNSDLSKAITVPRVDDDALVDTCIEGLHVGGCGVLTPVMSVVKKVILKCDEAKRKEIIELVWKSCMENKKTESFKKLMKHFFILLYHWDWISNGEQSDGDGDIHMKQYADLIFDDSNLMVVNAFMKHIQSLDIKSNPRPLFSHIVARALLFGPVLKKDDRLIFHVCEYIESLDICESGPVDTSNEIRGRAVEVIVTLEEASLKHRLFAEEVLEKLLEAESDLKRKIRYYENSQVHRLKHRLLQALLLLEPVLSANEAVRRRLFDELYNALLYENAQPSVKYQQEWLLIRILSRSSYLLSEFWCRFHDVVTRGIKAKGLCSLMVISYHLCKLVPSNEKKNLWISNAVRTFLPLCMDQQFEIRLHAQVILKKLYEVAGNFKLQNILDEFYIINESILKSIRKGRGGNTSKNCKKLEEDFFLNKFHPWDHFSLQVIYVDLPRLANVGFDEWISSKIFLRCGLRPSTDTNICIESSDASLEAIDSAKWSIAIPADVFSEDSLEDDTGVNYQKKMVPATASSVPEVLDNFECSNRPRINKKDGLIVVASLIGRIPNLGGLARTCEIFGASEYVVSSLKYVEDKQFQSLSVTAEKWVTIKEVKIENLTEYLLKMKENGYVIIGAEQTLFSQSLNVIKLPKKSLFLLGNEKEGIPPNFMPLLDICVEIPQVGIIRSLNVHVTGALFIWEYAKQNYFSGC